MGKKGHAYVQNACDLFNSCEALHFPPPPMPLLEKGHGAWGRPHFHFCIFPNEEMGVKEGDEGRVSR